MDESEIVGSFALPSNEQPAKSVVPRVCALYNPASWLAANTTDQWWLATPTNVRSDSSRSDSELRIRVVIAFVEAQVFRPSRSARRMDDYAVEHFGDEPFVMDVGA